MSTNNESKSFFDGNMILAISLVGLAWWGWNTHMEKKYPEHFSQVEKQRQEGVVAPVDKSVNNVAAEKRDNTVSTISNVARKNDEITSDLPRKEELTHYEDDIWAFDFSSKGMGLKNIVLKQYIGRDGKPRTIGVKDGNLPFETNVMGHRVPLDFTIKQTNGRQFFGTATYRDSIINKTVLLDPENYVMRTKIEVTGVTPEFTGLTTALSKYIESTESGPSFLPSFDRQEFYFSFNGDENERILFTADSDEDLTEHFKKTKIAAVGSQYFALALLDESGVVPDGKAFVDTKSRRATAVLSHEVLSRDRQFNVQYTAFAGPKSLKLLTGIDSSLGELIDLGWFGSIGKQILKLLKFFYGLIGNWGLAIILLTIVVRLLVMPFNLMSYKSMKKMQDIQPQLKALREKYKDDKQKLNEKTMALMRDSKANPLGGCLPMFIQIPVFIALYQVLGQSIELYQAPFGLWINDLSLKDPFFVLPVLMAATMFIQQKITPNTMDPAQAKVLMFLPIMFAFFMATLPSGLTLYIFVSTLFGVVQQFVFMRPDSRKGVIA